MAWRGRWRQLPRLGAADRRAQRRPARDVPAAARLRCPRGAHHGSIAYSRTRARMHVRARARARTACLQVRRHARAQVPVRNALLRPRVNGPSPVRCAAGAKAGQSRTRARMHSCARHGTVRHAPVVQLVSHPQVRRELSAAESARADALPARCACAHANSEQRRGRRASVAGQRCESRWLAARAVISHDLGARARHCRRQV
jgi:hypothetical protein